MKLEFTLIVALAVAAVSAAPLPLLDRAPIKGNAYPLDTRDVQERAIDWYPQTDDKKEITINQRAQMDGKADGHTKSGKTDITINTK
ncbi:UNVERIFIED_CONTAM: hypothetical protein HDU68_010169, partial [Siphonaria sp. JEL0065]